MKENYDWDSVYFLSNTIYNNNNYIDGMDVQEYYEIGDFFKTRMMLVVTGWNFDEILILHLRWFWQIINQIQREI